MIKKSILCFVILFGLHFIFVMRNPSLGSATHQWQDNIIKAQTFLYAEKIDTAMVGTSLSARIIRDSIPSVKSVSFGGCAVEDGLRIISQKEHLPKYVLVETNLFLHEGSEELVTKQTRGPIPQVRKWIPSLREQYEPICLLASLLLKSGNVNPQVGSSTVDLNVLNDRIEHHLKEDKTLSADIAAQRLSSIKSLMEDLETRGVQFIFFEMPVNDRLYHLKRYEQTRNILKAAFPQDKYLFLPSDTTKYLTTDGEHLDYMGQQVFSHYFKELLSHRNF
ncbi:MAG: hypothetical protein ILA34_05735 [Bacteroidaceae bacterium]|nr:hypothetical protein [Bacteroidaceae bacterium]